MAAARETRGEVACRFVIIVPRLDIMLTRDGYSLHNPIRLIGTIALQASDFIL